MRRLSFGTLLIGVNAGLVLLAVVAVTAYELYIFGGATAEFAPVLLNDMWRLTIPL
jgi:hypothetical protein